MNNISKDLDIDKKLRGFKHSESSRHLSNQIDKEDVDSLVKTVTSNYEDICHRYYCYKAKHFKKKKLDFWDRNAPYPGTKNILINWLEAKNIVLKSYYDFDNRIGDIAKIFFEKSWIHAKPLNGKTSGAFHIQQCHHVTLIFS